MRGKMKDDEMIRKSLARKIENHMIVLMEKSRKLISIGQKCVL
jgi:hypothetical protein